MVKTLNSWNNQVDSATVSFNGGTFNAGTDISSYPINIGTGTAAKNIILGNTTGTTQLRLQTGTGNFSLASASGTIINAANLGPVTMPLQPAFDAYQSVSITKIIGDGSSYTIPFNSTYFNTGNTYNTSTGFFSASVSGHYLLTCGVLFGPLVEQQVHYEAYIVTTNRRYLIAHGDPWDQVYFVPGTLTFTGTCFTNLSAGDWACINIWLERWDDDDKNASIWGDPTNSVSYFSGYLVC